MSRRDSQPVETEVMESTEAGTLEAMATEAVEAAPAEGAATPADTRVWELNGVVVSRAEFIRHQFMEEKKTRSQIREEFDFDYQAVYSATQNMSNGVEEVGGHGGGQKVFIEVNGAKIARNDYIVQLAKEGKTRGEIQKLIKEITGEEVKYQVIYNATKGLEGLEGTRNVTAKVVTLEDGTEMPRRDYIIMRHANGATIAEISTELQVAYQQVYAVIGKPAAVTIKADTVEELDQKYTEARAKMVEALEKAAEEAKAKAEAIQA